MHFLQWEMEIICTRHFVSRIGELQELSEKEKEWLYSAERQADGRAGLSGVWGFDTGGWGIEREGNEWKRIVLFSGRKYYEWYIQQNVGVTDTIQELEQLTRRQISEDITGMEEAVNEAAAILEDEKAERILKS